MSRPGILRLALAALLAATPLSAIAADAIEGILRSVAAGAQAPPDLRVHYSDTDSFDGGTRIQIGSDGRFLRWDSDGMKATYLTWQNEGRLEPSRVASLFKLLVEVETWRQLTPERRPVPDESQASLGI